MTSGIQISALPAAGVLSGAEIIPIVQSGVTKRTTIAGLGLSLDAGSGQYAVIDFGAAGNGVTDDSAAINNAIAAAAAAGGGTVLLGRDHAIASTIVCENSNIFICGLGADQNHNAGAQGGQAATTLTWTGAPGGTMIEFRSPQGAAAQKQRGGGLRGIWFDGDGVAAVGLHLKSWNSGFFDDIGFFDFTDAGLWLDVVQTLGDPRDTQQNIFRRITARQITSTGDVVRLQPSYLGANPSFNYFEGCDFSINNGNGWVFYSTDNNIIVRAKVNASGAGFGIVFHGSNTNGLAARNNAFLGYGAAKFIGYGTETYTYPSYNNNVYMVDKDNSTPFPTIGTDASIIYSYTDGTQYFSRHARGVFGQNAANCSAGLEAEVATPASLTVVNGNAANIALLDGLASPTRWLLRLMGDDFDCTMTATHSGAAQANVNFGAMGLGTLKINGIPMLGGGRVLAQPIVAPAAPASGWVFYCDSGDGNKLKAKASTGTIVLLGTP